MHFLCYSFCFDLPCHAQIKPLDLEFNNRFSEVLVLPYPKNNGSKNGGSRIRQYYLRKNNKPYTIDQGTCSVVGQEENPPGGFSYKVFINKNGVWVGYIKVGYHWPRGGICVQCIDNE